MNVSKFLGLDAPAKLEARFDDEDVSFTIEFETPEPPRMIAAIALEDPSRIGRSNWEHSTSYAPLMIDARFDGFALEDSSGE